MPESSSDPVRRTGWFARLALVAGVMAWGIALTAVWLTARSTDSDQTESTPAVVVGVPTLAAASVTPLPTSTATLTPVPATIVPTVPTLVPSPTVTLLPILSATPYRDSATDDIAALPTPTASPAALPTDAALSAVPQAVAAAPENDAAAQTCVPPDGWERYVVQQDDTLFAFVLGAGATLTVDDLIAANCLGSRYLQVNQVIFLPPGAAENAPPSVPAGPVELVGVHGPRTPDCPCTITVGTGWRREQIADAINAAQTLFTGADFLDATGSGASTAYDFVMARPGGASMEGFLFPGSYTVQNDTTADDFRDMLLGAFAANVSPQMRADAAAQGVTFYQALIIASIVQREVGGPETQKLVASVYYNRYRDGNRLGTTVAVQYALGGPGNWWPRVVGSDLEVDSPYNAYTHAGLPPTPIDSPGLSAIVAALYPPQTDYRYHTQGCHGEGEVFAATFEEHLANVNCE